MIPDTLQLWLDPLPRDGPESMAVDDWLLESVSEPLLRVYRWRGKWASLGYFGKIEEARAAISGVRWVRRRTGGGIVDHRADWTYTLAVPAGYPLARARGGGSYQMIHRALAKALAAQGIRTVLSGGGDATGAAECFANPVCHDLVGTDGRKLAGAGQRRTRHGLLHQGSVAVTCGDPAGGFRLAEAFCGQLSEGWKRREPAPPPARIARMAQEFAREEWTARR